MKSTKHLLVVGIGNITWPRTRHSVGHYLLDSISKRLGCNLSFDSRMDGYYGLREVDINGELTQISLFKPKPLMNVLGPAVNNALRMTVKRPSSMIVVQDSINLPQTHLKVKFGGSPDAHNGIRSISTALKTAAYFRLMIGVGRGPDVSKWVLGPLNSFEKEYWSVDGKGMEDVWKKIETISSRIDGMAQSKENED